MPNPDLILGTALWGWTIEQDTCFQMLDAFYEAGFRQIDAATNYPINKNPEQFRLSESYLTDWIRQRKIPDLRIIMKVGSLNNMAGPENNLSPAFLRMNLEDYRERFETNLDTFMIHWDNRSEPAEIAESLSVLSAANQVGIKPGLSGIKHPEVYHQLNQGNLRFRIEIKHNLLQSAYSHYQVFHGQADFLAYGINAGGLKLRREYSNNSSIRVRNISPEILEEKRKLLEEVVDHSSKVHSAPLQYMYQLGMLNCYHQADIKGILIGPSNLDQLQESIDCLSLIKNHQYLDTFEKMQAL